MDSLLSFFLYHGRHSIALPATLISLLIPLLFFLRFLRVWRPFMKDKGRYPPVVGTIFHQLFNYRRLYDYQTDLSRRFKTFRILTPWRNYIYTVDPPNVEYILKTNFANYGKGPCNYENMSALFGDGIFAVDGEKWRHQRKIASHEFSTKVLRDFSSVVFRNNAAKIAGAVSDAASKNRAFDIQDLFMKSTMDSIFKVGLGVELDTLYGSSEEGKEFSKAFDHSSEQMLMRFIDPFWKLKRFFNIGSEAALKKDVEVMDKLMYKVIRSKVEQMSRRQSDPMDKEDILSRFLIDREKDPENITDKYLRDIILNFTIAGRDTSAGTLAWFFYMLCKHPAVQERIAQEVTVATRTDGSINLAEFPGHLTEQALSKMHYLHAALSETLRLYPAVPLDGKFCFSDDTFPDGFVIKKGDMIDFQPYAMGRMKYIWGDDAEDFRPERWLDGNGEFQPESPFKFTAFQSGPRICLGKEFAYRQMKIFAATLLHFFKFKLRDEKKAVNYRPMITLQIDQGLHLLAFHRSCDAQD